MDLGLKGKKAFVGASSRGLGKAIAHSLAAEGVELFLTARDEVALAATAQEIEKRHGTVVHIKAVDMAIPEQAAALKTVCRKK